MTDWEYEKYLKKVTESRPSKIIDIQISSANSFRPLSEKEISNLSNSKFEVRLSILFQVGFDTDHHNYYIEANKVENFISKIKSLKDPFSAFKESWDLRHLVGTNLDLAKLLINLPLRRVDDCFEILWNADIVDENEEFFDHFVETFSEDKVRWAIETYSNNWKIALQTEYVLNNYPFYSLVSYAARVQFVYDILENEYAAEYLLREMQMVQKHEPLAMKHQELRFKAGKAGAKTSNLNKQKRLLSLLVNIETLIARNPAMSRLAPKHSARIAIEMSIEQDIKLWRQGKGQIDSYLSILASEEPYKTRFDDLFFKTA